jgi:hypothetical protein
VATAKAEIGIYAAQVGIRKEDLYCMEVNI